MPLKSGFRSKSYGAVIINDNRREYSIYVFEPTVNSATKAVKTSPCEGVKVIDCVSERRSSSDVGRANIPSDPQFVMN